MESFNIENMSTGQVLDQLFPPALAVELNSEAVYNSTVDLLKSLAYHWYKNLPSEQWPAQITDGNYDDLMRQLAQYEQSHPKEIRPDSPIGKEKGWIFAPDFSLGRPVVPEDTGSSGTAGTSPAG